jgi:hypothetical protein
VVEKLGQKGNWGWVEKTEHEVALGKPALAVGASFLASLINPYGHRVYGTFWAIENNAANRHLPRYTAMNFHQTQDYVVLLLAMAAFLALGMRRSRDVFLIAGLTASAMVAFHAQKESGLVTLMAIVVIGWAASRRESKMREHGSAGSTWQVLATAGVVVVAMGIAFLACVPRERSALLAKVSMNFPVRACDFIRERQLPGPIFNSPQWGSFLMWYLPEYPVALDGRRELYSEEEEADYFKVLNSEMPFQSFPPMKQARTLLLEKAGPLGAGLRGVAGFQLAYEDEIAIALLQEKED